MAGNFGHAAYAVPIAGAGAVGAGYGVSEALGLNDPKPTNDFYDRPNNAKPPVYGGTHTGLQHHVSPGYGIVGPGEYDTPTDVPNLPGGSSSISDVGIQHMRSPDAGQNWAMGQMTKNRGAQAWENQDLSDREAQARGYDQAGALQLQREAAMGMAPSEAAYMMQQGLDQSLANQQAMAGSARGGAALALSQGNAQANAANMQNQAFSRAGQMRAAEMAQARGAYGDLSSQQRQQDLGRLGMGNQMSQFNAGLNDQYRMGMGNLANQFGQQSQGWYRGAQAPYEAQLQADTQRYMADVGAGTAANRLGQEQNQFNRQANWAANDRIINGVATGAQVAGGLYNAGGGGNGSGMGGSQPPGQQPYGGVPISREDPYTDDSTANHPDIGNF